MLCASEFFVDARLFQNRVGGMAAFDVVRNGKIDVGYRAIPDFVASLAMPHKRATCIFQNFKQPTVE